MKNKNLNYVIYCNSITALKRGIDLSHMIRLAMFVYKLNKIKLYSQEYNNIKGISSEIGFYIQHSLKEAFKFVYSNGGG